LLGTHSILIVEDTELIRKIYADKLVQEGFQVFPAANGQQALNLLKNNNVDLILLDLIMPTMSGLEVLEAIKSDPRFRNIPVIVLTNLGQDSDVQRGLSLGAADYLIKNESRPADVLEKINSVLSVQPSHNENTGNVYRLYVRDREGDVDRLVDDLALIRRLWCPACEDEYILELVPKLEQVGWFDATFICLNCGNRPQR